MRKKRYPYLTMVLKIGVASFPNGHPLNLFVSLGVPTRSIITELVNQYAAVEGQSSSPAGTQQTGSIPKENQVIISPQQLYII